MILSTAVLASALLAAPPQARDARPPDTDQTVSVAKGARLTIDNYAGEVLVKVWDRDAVRVQARHGERAKVNIRTVASGIAVSAAAGSTLTRSVDYEITAPAWMPVRVTGTYNFVTIDGAQAEVAVENVKGDIVIKGGTGTVTARSVQGEIVAEGVRGKVTLSTVNEGIRVRGASGDVSVETTNGDITMSGMDASSLEVGTVNGTVRYEGRVRDNGIYRIATHNGDVVLYLPDATNATFTVRTYNGGFRSALATKGPPASEPSRGRRVAYTIGSGSADVDVESFGGDVLLRKPEQVPWADKTKVKDKEKEKEKDDRE